VLIRIQNVRSFFRKSTGERRYDALSIGTSNEQDGGLGRIGR
jgi:hypothetical protein